MRLRTNGPLWQLFGSSSWKVTARFEVVVSRTERLACIRIRGPYTTGGNAIVLHLSEKEFRRLFESVDVRRKSVTLG